MAGRSVLLTVSGTQALISWISREDSTERFEVAAYDGYLAGDTPEALERDGIPMTWVGQASEQLGLDSSATPAAAARVLVHGVGPHGEALRTHVQAQTRKDTKTGEEIIQERRDTMGWVLSAPKTLSLLSAHPDPTVRQAVAEAMDAASMAAVAELEASVTTRRGRGGYRTERIQGLVGVQAQHLTSSAGDPHLHVHYILNASAPAASDGRWRALDSKVLFATQRVGEAAFQRTLRDELSRRLNLSEEAWTIRMVGSVPTYELTELQDAIDRYARATAHMQDAAQKMGIRLGAETYRQHGRIWAQHREEKGALAELLEHKLDAALADGGDDAANIRAEWLARMGQEAPFLMQVHVRDNPVPVARQTISPTETDALTNPDRDRALEHAITEHTTKIQALQHDFQRNHRDRWIHQTDLDRLTVQLENHRVTQPGFWATKTRKAAWHTTLTALENQKTQAQQYLNTFTEIVESQASLVRLQTEQHQRNTDRQEARHTLNQLVAQLGVFSPIDVVAYARGLGLSTEDARQHATNLLDFWYRDGLIQFKDGQNPEAIFAAVRDGFTTDTRLQHHANSHAGKVVATQLLNLEHQVQEQARELGQTPRRPLVIDATSLTPDQGRAASLIAQGQGLTAIQGVAGAGKSYLLRPVVTAAQHQEMDVFVLARNAKLAGELGSELNVRSSTIARWKQQNHAPKRPTLLILDEAGLVDQADWQAILHAVQQHAQIQVVALGDRRQAQAIDRRATWAVVTNATQDVGTFAELTQTFRNKAWEAEAHTLREGKAEAAQIAASEDRIVAAAPRSTTEALLYNGHLGPERAAQTVLQQIRHGEDALAIAATNEEVAAIATAIQEHKEITVDSRTHLRWDQQTGIGDQVRTRKNEYRARIRNGDTWTVRRIDDQTITLQATDGRAARVSHRWAQDHLELAYAGTVDSSQGVTVDRAVVLMGPALGQSGVYSATTRGRQAPIYVAEARTPEQAQSVVAQAIHRDDLARTMTEHLQADKPEPLPAWETARQLLQSPAGRNWLEWDQARQRVEQTGGDTRWISVPKHLQPVNQPLSRLRETFQREATQHIQQTRPQWRFEKVPDPQHTQAFANHIAEQAMRLTIPQPRSGNASILDAIIDALAETIQQDQDTAKRLHRATDSALEQALMNPWLDPIQRAQIQAALQEQEQEWER